MLLFHNFIQFHTISKVNTPLYLLSASFGKTRRGRPGLLGVSPTNLHDMREEEHHPCVHTASKPNARQNLFLLPLSPLASISTVSNTHEQMRKNSRPPPFNHGRCNKSPAFLYHDQTKRDHRPFLAMLCWMLLTKRHEVPVISASIRRRSRK